MNPMHGPSHILPILKVFIATEVESRHSLPAKAVRESLGIKFLDCKKRVASGRKSLGSFPVRPSPAHEARLIVKVNGYEKRVHRLQGPSLVKAVDPGGPNIRILDPIPLLVGKTGVLWEESAYCRLLLCPL